MEAYELQQQPFVSNPTEGRFLFHGVSLERNRLPIIAKRYDFPFISQKSQQRLLNRAINIAILQAKASHPNCCELFEVQIEIKETGCSLYHILEALNGNVYEGLEQRKARKQVYSETEIRSFLYQISSALAFAHSKVSVT